MKRFFLFGLASLILISVVSATAQKLLSESANHQVPTSGSSTQTVTLAASDAVPELNSGSALPVEKLFKSSAPRKAVSATDFTGTWIQVNTSIYDGRRSSPAIAVEQSGNGVLITGLYLTGSKVNGTFDAASGRIKIAPQVIYNHPTYGECGLHTFSVSGGKVVMNATAPIEMWIADDGTLQMSPWGLFVDKGSYAGSAFDAYTESVAGHPNGSFKSTPFSADTESIDAQVWVSQPNDGEVMVANMLGNARAFSITLAPGSAYIAPQYVMSADLYGDFFLYAANSNGKIDKNNYITVTATETGYSLSSWGIFCLASNSVVVTTGQSSELTTSFKFTYPTVSANPMQGTGTEADPWLVKTVDDLKYIALSTTKENSYEGKYFKLAANIDLSGFKGHWFPIGTIQTEPFQGSFDGVGYTISGLNQDFSGAMGAGIFGFTGAKSVLKNIKVTGINYQGCGKNIGGLVGYAMGPVENCSVEGRIQATNNEIGGVAGYSTSSITGCSFKGDLYGGIDIGGIVAYTTGTVTRCTSNANVVLSTHVPYAAINTHALGGIAAACYGTSSKPVTVSECMASGIVADLQASDHIGGITGYINNTTVTECLSNVQVVSNAASAVDGASPAAGGIVGYASRGEINNCMVAGALNAASTTFAGGICGYGGGASTYQVKFINNLVVGMVNTSSEWEKVGVTGDFFAKAPLTIEHCYYDSQATGLDTIGIGHKPTADLISGTLPEGFSTEVWSCTKGFYPVLKAFAGTPETDLASVPVILSGAQTIRKVTSNFTVGVTGNVKWGVLSSDGTISTESVGLSVNGNTVTLKPEYASDNLVAYLPDNTYKSFTIKVTPKAFEGNGTADSPFLIKTVNDLLTLQKAVNEARQPHSGDYFLLTADLDLGATPKYTGIAAGDASLKFGGIFDGGNHRISNFKIEGAVKGGDGALTGKKSYMGFFGICTKTSAVKNLIIDKSCDFTFYRYSAPVVGYTTGEVTNCINYAPVRSWGVYNGGVVGLAGDVTANITGCANFGKIDAVDGFVGGIVGVNYGDVHISFNAGSISLVPDAAVSTAGDNANVGGIAGANYGNIRLSENNGQIAGVASVGGIVGGNTNTQGAGSVTGCVNSAVVNGDGTNTKVGAIIGNLAASTEIADNVYDRQIMPQGATGSGDVRGCEGILTSEFSKYANSSYWVSTDGYPVPATFSNNADVKNAASVQILFSPLDVLTEIESQATLKGSSTTWSLDPAGPFSISGSTLSLSLSDAQNGTGTLIASTPFGTKQFALRAVKPLFAGAGTEADPHLIASVTDMVKLSDAVNTQQRSYAGHHFKVTANLDFKDVTFAPVGSKDIPFQGNFNGDGHKISNLTIDVLTDFTGLFGFGGPVAVISNLSMDTTCSITGKAYTGSFAGRFDGAIINCTTEAKVASTGNYTGGFVGYMAEGSSFTNCVSRAGVNAGGTYTGGLAGVLYGDASNCSNAGTVKGKTTYVGGLAGALRGSLVNCENTGEVSSVSGGNYLGGLAAIIEAGSAMENCVNRGDIKNGFAYVGGLYGSCPTTTGMMRENGAFITRCSNYGAITGTKTNVGGLAGLMGAGHHMYGCENYGTVTATGGNTTGGLVGETRGDDGFSTTIDSCFNYAAVENTAAKKKDVGGLAGKLAANSTITRCGNFGNVTSAGYMTGGLVGDALGCISDSFNAGDVQGATYAMGGIAGYTGSDALVDRCVNIANVKATDSYTGSYGTAGGIMGYGYAVLTDCANYGNVEGSKTVGGIAGSRFGSFDIIRCVTSGEITVPEGVTSVGNIFGSSLEFTGPVWFNKDINGALAADNASWTGVSSDSLMNLLPDNNWILNTASYPVPASLTESAAVRFGAGSYKLKPGDIPGKVTDDFKVVNFPGLVWTSSNESVIHISGENARVHEADNVPVTLTLTWNGRSKKFNFVVKSSGSVGDLQTSEIAGYEFYNLSGVRIATPDKGTLCIRKTIFTDGSVKVEKIVF